MSGGNLWEMGRPAERQYSDTLTPQQGVEDKSAATKMTGYASAVGSLSSTASTAMSAYDDITEKKQEAAEVDAYNVYDAGLVQYREMQKSGVPQEKLRGYMADLESKVGSMGLDAKARVTHRAKREGLEMWEKSPEEEIRAEITDSGLREGFDRNDPNFYAKAERAWELKNNPKKEVNSMIGGAVQLVSDHLDVMRPGETFQEFEARAESYQAMVRQSVVHLPKEARDQVINAADKLITSRLTKHDPKKRSANSKAVVDAMGSEELAQLFKANNGVSTYLRLLEIAPNANVTKQLGNRVEGDLLATLLDMGKGVDQLAQGQMPQSGSPEGKASLSAVSDQIVSELRGEGISPTSEKIVATIVDQAPQQIELGEPWEYEAVIDSLYSGVGDAIADMGTKLDFDRKQRLIDSVEKEFTNNILPIINNTVNDKAIFGGNARGFGGRTSSPTSAAQFLKVGMWGDRVVFSAQTKEQGVPEHAQRLNKKLSKDLSKFIVAQAKLTGTSPEEVLNTYIPLILPDSKINPIEQVGEVSQEGVQQGEPVGNSDGVSEPTQLPEWDRQAARAREGVGNFREENPGSKALEGPVPFDQSVGSELLAGRVPGGETPIPSNSPMSGRSAQAAEERGPVVANPTFEQRALRRAQDNVEAYKRMNPQEVKGLSDDEISEVLQTGIDKKVATSVMRHEGYYEGSRVARNMKGNGAFNVPAAGNSGLTIAGIDVGQVTSGPVFDVIRGKMTTEQKAIFDTAVGQTRQGGNNQAALETIADDLDAAGFKLTNEEIKDIQAMEIKQVSDKLAKAIGVGPFYALDPRIKVALASQVFNYWGPSSVDAVAKAVQSGLEEDWEAAKEEFSNYGWSAGTSASNIERTDEVAEAIGEFIEDAYG